MIIRSDDPIRDYDRWEYQNALWERSRPICEDCGDPITEEYMWDFHGKKYCEKCVRDHREYIED